MDRPAPRLAFRSCGTCGIAVPDGHCDLHPWAPLLFMPSGITPGLSGVHGSYPNVRQITSITKVGLRPNGGAAS